MHRKLLTGLTAALIALGSASASASTGDEVLLGRLSGATELTQSGVAMVNFVRGSAFVPERVDHVIKASDSRAEAQAARYYGDSTALTVAMLVMAAFAFVGIALASRAVGKGRGSEPPRPERWKEEVMRMLEADLTNFDGLKHRLSAH
jgi:hypothetical protein